VVVVDRDAPDDDAVEEWIAVVAGAPVGAAAEVLAAAAVFEPCFAEAWCLVA
jgi:hypothetical protein